MDSYLHPSRIDDGKDVEDSEEKGKWFTYEIYHCIVTHLAVHQTFDLISVNPSFVNM